MLAAGGGGRGGQLAKEDRDPQPLLSGAAPSSALSRTVVSTLHALRALLTTAASRAPCASTGQTPEQTLCALQARDVPKGTVSVRVVRGAGLLAADSGGTSDPYVLVSVPTRYDGGNTARTSAKKKTLNPEWEETLETLHVYDAADRCMLSFSVWDHDNLGMNDDLGTGEALLRNCAPGVPTPLTIPLSTQGSIEARAARPKCRPPRA